MEKISYKLQDFEGPLDLILHLISKNKLSIYDIKISEILDQYLEYIKEAGENQIDVSSEFLEMAARLVYIKTISLLPKQEEEEKLKQELSGQLLEYKECKIMATVIAEKISFDSFCREPENIDFDMTYKGKHIATELLDALTNATGRGQRKLPPPAETFSEIVSKKIIPVAASIINILRKIWKTKEIKYDLLFEKSRGKSHLVATFLAVLELAKGKRIRIEGFGSEAKVKLISGGKKLGDKTTSVRDRSNFIRER